MNSYLSFYGPQALPTAPDLVTDQDILKKEYRFVRTEEDDVNDGSNSWDKQLAKRYYDQLFKEYALADFSRYKEGKVGLRWRTKNEVLVGKGQFICGNKRCDSTENLRSFELPFSYVEEKVQKSALVKVRVCPDCAYKLNYKKIKEIKKKEKKKGKKKVKRQQEDSVEKHTKRLKTEEREDEREDEERVFDGLFP